jgi:serine/threonine protein kinase/WD40 repeat protein
MNGDDSLLAHLLERWHRLRQQGQDPSLRELCGDDPALLSRFQEAIAAQQDEGTTRPSESRSDPEIPATLADAANEGIRSGPATGAGGPVPFPTLPAPGAGASGEIVPALWEQVPGYEILDELGRGGMGVVYKARQVGLGRLVALKMILAGGRAGRDDLLRFRTEAEAAARLQHPNIVQVFEIGEYQGRPFFSLEFCEGGALDQLLAGTPLPPAVASRLVEDLARAMHVAHLADVVHRDLKPANILLAHQPSSHARADTAVRSEHSTLKELPGDASALAGLVPKIADFGLAKKLDEVGLTQTGAVMGTPSYMAPEQAQGKKIGPPADIYALGAILYECLTGRPPFRAATVMDTLRQVVTEEPVPPRRLNARIPVDLDTVCMKCLDKDPGKRYATAEELADDLRRFQEGEPILARPVSVLERTGKWARRNPAVAWSLLVVFLSLLAATTVSSLFGLRAEQARRAEAEHARTEVSARHEAELARRETRKQVIDLCGTAGLTAAREQDPSLALLWFTRAVALADEEPAAQELNRIRVANWLRQVSLPAGSFTIPHFREHQDRVRNFEFSPDGQYLLVVATTGDCLVWDCRRGRLVLPADATPRDGTAAWEPKQGLLAVAGKEGRIRLLAPPTFAPVEEVKADGEVSVLAFSRDGQRLAWGGPEGARVWDRGKKEYISPWLAHPSQVTTLSFSASGELLATSAGDLKARVFQIREGEKEPLFPPIAHLRPEHGLAHGGPDRVAPRFAANDQVLLTAEREPQHAARLVWRSATTGTFLQARTPPPGQDFLTAFAVNPQGTQAAVMWEDQGELCDARTGGILAAITTGSRYNWCEDVTFAPDGKTLVTCGHNMLAQGWSVDDRSDHHLQAAFPPVLHPMKVVRANLSPDGAHLVTVLWDGTVHSWRLPAGLHPVYSLSAGGTTLPVVSPDGRFVLPGGTTYRNGTQLVTRVHDADAGEAAGPVLDPGGILLNAVFSPDGTRVATAASTGHTIQERARRLFLPEGKGGNVQLWDWRTGKRLGELIATPAEPRGLAFHPNGRTLAVVCADYQVVLADTEKGTVTRRLDPGIRTRPRDANLWWGNGEARFSPDGRILVTWEMVPPVHVWDAETGRLVHTLPHDERVESVAFSPVDPTLLATAGRDSAARVWNLSDGKLLAQLQHPGNLSRIRFSPDGTELFTSCLDGMLRAWNWRAGTLTEGLALHSSMIMDFGFTADRRWLITLGHHGVQVTDVRTGTPAGPLWSLGRSIHLALVLPQGDRRVIIGGFSRTLEAYDLTAMTTPVSGAAEDLVRLAELTAGRRILSQGSVVPLTGAEWAERLKQLARLAHRG